MFSFFFTCLGFVSLVLGIVSRVLGIVCWVLGFVFWVLGFVFWVSGIVFWVLEQFLLEPNCFCSRPHVSSLLLGDRWMSHLWWTETHHGKQDM